MTAVRSVEQDKALHAKLVQLREKARHFEQDIAELMDAVAITRVDERD